MSLSRTTEPITLVFAMVSSVAPAMTAPTPVQWNDRRIVICTNLFAGWIASAVGVMIFGALAIAIFRMAGTETDVEVVEQDFGVVFISVAVVTVVTDGCGRDRYNAVVACRGREAAAA